MMPNPPQIYRVSRPASPLKTNPLKRVGFNLLSNHFLLYSIVIVDID